MTTTELTRKLLELENKLRHLVVRRCDELPTTNVGKIVIFGSNLYFWDGDKYEKLTTENALEDALDSVGIGTNIEVVNFYSNLPAATSNAGHFYWVENDEGTWWMPGNLGGTYYKKGLYYSNGTVWETAPVPYNATQLEVDAGIERYKFVTPFTLKNRIDTVITTQNQLHNYLHDQGIPLAQWIITHNLNKYPSVTVIDSSNREVEGAVEHLNLNELKISFNNPFSGKATLN